MLLPILFVLLSTVLLADPPAGLIQTVVGTNFVGDGGSASSALLSQPEGIAVDAIGNVYIADADDSRVRRVTPGGLIETVAGTGLPGFRGDSGPGTFAQLDHPYGLALDTTGNLFIADLGNARIRKLSPDGVIVTVAGGGLTLPGSAVDSTLARDVKLTSPRNVAVDTGGNLYISDFGANQVYRVAPGGLFSVFAGTGKAGSSGDNGLAKSATLSAPAGLGADANGNVYVADTGNSKVRKISRGVITTAFSVNIPTGLAVGANGAVYVAGADYFGTFAHSVGTGILARDVAIDPAGTLYWTSKPLVRKMAIDGNIKIVAGNGAARYFGGDGGPAALARLHSPNGIAEDDLGNLYIADTDNHRIRRVTPGGIMTTFAGTGEKGSSTGNSTGMLAQLNTPRSIALDSLRNVYVADTGNNRICRISPGGAFSVIADQLNDPEAIAIDANDVLYVADTGSNRVLKLAASGTPDLAVDALKPVGLVIDRTGTLYISESSRVSKLPLGKSLTTALDGLKSPRGLALSTTGDLVIAETGANRVKLLSPAGVVSTLAGSGLPGYAGDGGPATTAQLNAATNVAVDPTGTILIADTANNRVRSVTPPSSTQGPASLSTIATVNAASLAPGPIAPSEIVSIFGAGFDPTQTQVQFDGLPATIFYVSSSQINLLVPKDLKPGSVADLTISAGGTLLAEAQVQVTAAAPAFFTAAQGTGPAAALNEDGSANSEATPATRGSIVSFYATGWDSTPAGLVLTIGGYSAEILYAGPAPGYLGLQQINARVPSGFLAPGIQPVVLHVATSTTQEGVLIAVK